MHTAYGFSLRHAQAKVLYSDSVRGSYRQSPRALSSCRKNADCRARIKHHTCLSVFFVEMDEVICTCDVLSINTTRTYMYVKRLRVPTSPPPPPPSSPHPPGTVSCVRVDTLTASRAVQGLSCGL